MLATVVIFRSVDDELYEFYKRLFEEKVSQMVTIRLIRMKERLPKEELHKYRNIIMNLISGLLGKLSLRPWLLDDELKAKAYIGIDLLPGRAAAVTLMDTWGNYMGEEWITLRDQRLAQMTCIILYID